MPIKPENKHLYPDNWKDIRAELLEEYGNCCQGSMAYPDCRAANGQPHPVTGSRVVLTIAHWPDHSPTNNHRKNLNVWCQRCHLAMDQPHRLKTAALTRKRKRLAMEMEKLVLSAEDLIQKSEELDAMTTDPITPEVRKGLSTLKKRIAIFEKLDFEVKKESLRLASNQIPLPVRG